MRAATSIPFKKLRFQSGFSLVELMVSMLIGLMVLGGVLQVILAGKKNYQDQHDISYIQDNTRYVMDILAKDIRLAGYKGCSNQGAAITNVIKTNVFTKLIGSDLSAGFKPLEGFDNVSVSEFTGNKSDADAFIVRRGGTEWEFPVKSHDSNNNKIAIWGTANFTKGQPMMLIDSSCQQVAVFTATDATSTEITHAASGNNCNSKLRGNYTCGGGSAGVGNKTFPVGSRLMPYVASGYYIANSSVNPSIPALKRMSLRVGTAGLETFEEEIAQGVSDMEILYGVTDNAGKVIGYRTAADVSDWSKIDAVQIKLTFQAPGKGAQPSMLTRDVTSTIQIRNEV
jgi:type IV pilus assembly protein PilW